MMSEIVQELVTETSQKAFTDRDLQPASAPNPQFQSDMDQVIEGKADLEYDVHAEILPEFEPMDVSTLELERLVAEVPQEDLDEALGKVAEQQRSYAAREEGATSEEGDMVTVNYVGRIDGEGV